MSLPNMPARDDRLLIGYLVGSLTEEETERLDEMSVADDRFAADLHAVEHDLVDAYVGGRLSGDTLRRFEAHYLSSPAARAKVAFARALLRYQESAAAAPSRDAGRGRQRGVPALLTWALAAAAMLLVATAAYLFFENNRLTHEELQMRAGLEGRQQQLEQQLRQERSALADAARELDRLRQSLAKAREAPPNTAVAARPVLASFVLLPPIRGVGDVPTLSIPPGPGAVAFQLNLEASDFPTYRVALRDAAGRQILWRSAPLRAVRRGDASALPITLGTDLLRPRTYMLDVTGVPVRGAAQSVGSYTFRIVLQ
jgi:hypothetical protein